MKLGHEVTLIGSGPAAAQANHIDTSRRRQAHAREFERWPSVPTLRNETAWEEATFVPGLLAKYRPDDYDITATCAFPLTQWALRRPVFGGHRPRNVFITQNGDWPALSDKAEFRFFDCDGLVCINPDYFERNRGPLSLRADSQRRRSRPFPSGTVRTRKVRPAGKGADRPDGQCPDCRARMSPRA